MKIPQQKKPINNFPLKVVAVIFAIFLWFYVDAQQNPLADQRFDVPIDYVGLAEDLSYSGGSSTVTVTIKGRQDRVSNLRSSDFTATVDLSEAVLGENQLPVKVTTPANVEISSTRPSKVTVTLDRMTEINMEVQPTVLGTAAEGYTRFAPSIKPTTVLVQGSETLLEQIASAKVEIDATGATENLVLTLPVKLVTDEGVVLDNKSVTVTPQAVEVFLPIDQDTPSKMVTIKPNLVGQPAKGYAVSRVVAEPETVKIVGSFEDIDKIDQLTTKPIYISNIAADMVQEAELVIPDGVTLMNTNTVKVLVTVAQSAVTKTVDIPITVRGDSEYDVTLSQTTAQVTIEGQEEELDDAAKLAGIVPYVSISGLEAGTHTLELHLEDDSGLHVTQIQPAAVEVTLTPKENTPAPENP